jgi:hypothetical protein
MPQQEPSISVFGKIKAQKLESVLNNACINDQGNSLSNGTHSSLFGCTGMARSGDVGELVRRSARCLLVSGSLNFAVAGMLVKEICLN